MPTSPGTKDHENDIGQLSNHFSDERESRRRKERQRRAQMSSQVFQIRQGDEHLSSHSGLGLVGVLLARTSINKRVNPIPIVDTPPISNGDVTRAMIGLCCLGKPDFDAIKPMRKEPFFARALGLRKCPSSPTLCQRFDLIDGQFDSILKEESAFLIGKVAPEIIPIRTEEDGALLSP